MSDFELSELILKCAYKVHTKLGSGLLEKVYQVCLRHELKLAGLDVEAEVSFPVIYDDLRIENAFRLDLVVENRYVIEIKVTDGIHENHEAQLITYLRFSGIKYGLLLNFKEKSLRNGIRRKAL